MRYLFLLILVAAVGLGVYGYRSATSSQRLFDEYFTAIPPAGYGDLRGVVVTEETSLARQAMSYHREQRHEYALTGWRAYLETDPLPEEFLPHLLAATSALAGGRYYEGEALLNAMPRETEEARANYLWYAALIALRKDDRTRARALLDQIPPEELTPEWRGWIVDLETKLETPEGK